MLLSAVLSGALFGLAAPVQDEKPGGKPVLPGEPGYVLKRAREMVELAHCRDAERRTDLLLTHARERLHEREVLGAGPFTAEGDGVARSLGNSYRRLALDGGAGAGAGGGGARRGRARGPKPDVRRP